MLALQRRESGGDDEGVDKLWDGLQLLEEAYTSGSIGNLQHLINNSTAKDVPTAKDNEFPPIKPYEAQSVTRQDEQQRPVLQKPVLTSNHPSQDILLWRVKPTGGLQNGHQETSWQPRLTPSRPTGTEQEKELAHSHTKDAENHQKELGTIQNRAEHSIKPNQVEMRSDSFNGSVIHSLATGSLKSFRRRKPQPWPDSQQSLGEMIKTDSKKIKGKVWLAEGPALEVFEAQIRPQIEQLLHNTEPPQCAPLLLTLYMIGKADVSASPIIMLCCRDRKVRKDAEAVIRQSDVLQQFPQFGLGNSATLLETTSFVVPVTRRSTESQTDAPGPSSFEIHASEEPIIGRRLRLIVKAEGRELVRFATGGPFVRIENQVYQLTAFHYGQGDVDTDSVADLDSDSDECEYDGQSDTEEDESDLEEGTTDTTPTFKEKVSMSLENESTAPFMAHMTDVVLEKHDRQDPRSWRTLLNFSNIDYFLVRLPTVEASKASNSFAVDFENHRLLQVTDIGAPPASRTPVIVVTSNNRLTGTILPGTIRVKLHGFCGFQDLLTARLSRSIQPGDSGSAVVDASTGYLYGHIVLASAPDALVYIAPSVNIFTHIVSIFGKLPALNLDGPIPKQQIPQEVQKQRRLGVANGSSHLWKYAKRALGFSRLSDSVRSDTTRLGSKQSEEDESKQTRPKARPSSHFEPGNIFQVIWSDPVIPNARFDFNSLKDHQSSLRQVRGRFIVARTDEEHFYCVPIRTYDKLGCTKYGVRPHDHGIIYDKGSQPMPLRGEPQLGFSPICFDPCHNKRIGREARVDYSKVVVVARDSRADLIGMIRSEDLPIVQDAVDCCWNKKDAHGSSKYGNQEDGKMVDSTSLLGGDQATLSEYGSTFRDSSSFLETDESGQQGPAKASWPTQEGTEVTKFSNEHSRGPPESSAPPYPTSQVSLGMSKQFNRPHNLESIHDPQQSMWSRDLQNSHDQKSAVAYSEVPVSFTTGQSQVVREMMGSEESDEVTWNFTNAMYDDDLERWYWEGQRNDGRKLRKYHPVDVET